MVKTKSPQNNIPQMKSFRTFKVAAILFLFILLHSDLPAQNSTEDKLPGCWKVKSVEFIKSTENADEIANEAKAMITCFEKNGKFTTKFLENDKEIIVGTGTFKIGSDGKTIQSKRDVDAADDDGTDAPGEIIKINEREFSIRVEDIILHYERLK